RSIRDRAGDHDHASRRVLTTRLTDQRRLLGWPLLWKKRRDGVFANLSQTIALVQTSPRGSGEGQAGRWDLKSPANPYDPQCAKAIVPCISFSGARLSAQ